MTFSDFFQKTVSHLKTSIFPGPYLGTHTYRTFENKTVRRGTRSLREKKKGATSKTLNLNILFNIDYISMIKTLNEKKKIITQIYF